MPPTWERLLSVQRVSALDGPPATHDVSLSTPWTVFAWPVNVVGGVIVERSVDLALPSTGFGTSLERTYTSAAASRTGAFGAGWFWTYGAQFFPAAATVVWADGRADTYTLTGTVFVPPAGIYDQLTQNADGTYTVLRPDQARYTFSATGQLQQVSDRNGNALRVTYSGGAVTGLSDTAGRTWTLQTDVSGRITQATDPAGRTVRYQYSAVGDLTQVTDALGNTTQYAYDGVHRLTGVTDALGHHTSVAYDTQGRVSNLTDAANGVTTFGYDTTNRRTTVANSLGHSHIYSYDASNRVSGVTDALGKTETGTWDASNNRTAVTDRNGHTTSSTYDAQGNVTQVTDALGGQTTTTYDARNNPLTRRDANSHTTSSTYDARGNVTQITDAAGNTTTFTYDAKGQRLTSTDPNGHTTTFAYDANGNRTSVTDALGHTTTHTYDAAGRVLAETDPDGRVTSHTYDALGHVLSTTDGAGGVSRASYDAVGNRLTSTDPLGHVTSYTYDPRNLRIQERDALGQATTTTYDSVGNRTAVTDPLGHTTSFAYDANNRLTSTTDANGHSASSTYDAVGNQASATDANGRTTSFDYDALNRLVRVTDPLGGRAVYDYDAVGNRTSTTDPNNQTNRVTHDAVNRPVAQVDPLNNTHAYVYDGVGNLLSKTDANHQQTTYDYDADNRLTAAHYPEGTVSYVYDGAGDRTSMTDPVAGTTTFTYDGARRLTSNASTTGTVSYAYDLAGNLGSLTYPGGDTVTYSYDALNRVATVTDRNGQTSRFTFDAAGHRATTAYPNGTRATFTYDAGGRVAAIQWTGPGGGNVAAISYVYDAAGNRTRVADATETSNFAYDALDRLTQATYGDGTSAAYTYDAAGNRLTMTSGGATTSYTYDAANRLQTIGPDQVTWDGNGNIARRGSTSYVFDSQNRLLQVRSADQTVQMAYDGDNRRVTRVASGMTTAYQYDEHTSLAQVVKESNAQRSQLYGLNGQVLWDLTSDGSQLYYHQDALGSTAAVTKSDGSLAGTFRYDAFGTPKDPATVPGSFWFAGEQYDPETGLLYLRARYYDPASGRFLSADPAAPDLRNTQALNAFAYASNNPLRYTDPSGEFLQEYYNFTHRRDVQLAITVGGLSVTALGLIGCAASVVCGVVATAGTVVLEVHSALSVGGDIANMTSKSSIHANDVLELSEDATDAILPGINRIGKARGLADLEKVGNGSVAVTDGLLTGVGAFNTLLDDPDTSGQGHDAESTQSPLISSRNLSVGPHLPSSSDHDCCSSRDALSRMHQASQPLGRAPSTSLQRTGGSYVPPNTPPNSPVNLSPATQTTTSSGSVTLTWQSNGSPDNVTIDRSKVTITPAAAGSATIKSDWIASTSYVAQGLVPGAYTWTVQVRDIRGLTSAASDPWTFTVPGPRVLPTDSSQLRISSPPDNGWADGPTVHFAWGPAQPGDGPYVIQASDIGGHGYGVVTQQVDSAAVDLTLGQSRWGVAVRYARAGNYSPAITVNVGPRDSSILQFKAPADGLRVQGPSVLFDWTPGTSGPFVLQATDVGGGGNGTITTTVDAPPAMLNLPNGMWGVAVRYSLAGNLSAAIHITVGPPPSDSSQLHFTQPADESSTRTTDLSFSWGPVSPGDGPFVIQATDVGGGGGGTITTQVDGPPVTLHLGIGRWGVGVRYARAGNYSAAIHVNVLGPPADSSQLHLTTPPDECWVDGPGVMFDWGPVAAGDGPFVIQAADVGGHGYAPITTQVDGPPATLQLPASRWGVAVRYARAGNYSAAIHVNVGTPTSAGIQLIGPADNGWVDGPNVVFNWAPGTCGPFVVQASDVGGTGHGVVTTTVDGPPVTLQLPNGRWGVGVRYARAGDYSPAIHVNVGRPPLAPLPWAAQAARVSDILFGAAATSPLLAWTVGDGGRILATTDGGRTWVNQASSTTNRLQAITAASYSTAWAVGEGGTILSTVDGGGTWHAQPSGVAIPLRQVAAVSASLGWVVGNNGTILATTNGGATWISQSSGTTAHLYGVAAASSAVVWAVGQNGAILRTTDGGASWSAQPSGTTQTLRAIAALNASTAWAVGEGGTILKTNDGTTWTAEPSGTSDVLVAIVSITSSVIWVADEAGSLLASNDGGVTWTVQLTSTSTAFQGLAAASSSDLWAVGTGGAIVASNGLNGTAQTLTPTPNAPTATPLVSPTSTFTPSVTPTATPTGIGVVTPSLTPSASSSPTATTTPTPTVTPSPTPSPTATATATATPPVIYTTRSAIYGGNVTLDGQPAPVGVVVQAYCRQQTVCGQATLTQAGTYRLVVYGYDGTAGSEQYAQSGDTVTFTVNGYPATLASATPWQNQGATVVALAAHTVVTQTRSLPSGWSLVSFSVTPDSLRLVDVLSSLGTSIDVVYGFDQSQGGVTSYFSDPAKEVLNNLDTLQPLQGYWVHLTSAGTLRLTGRPLATTTTVSLRPGWNLVGYHGHGAKALLQALTPLASHYDVIYGFDQSQGGTTSYFSDPNRSVLNNLDTLQPLQGYWVHVTGGSALPWSAGLDDVSTTSVSPTPSVTSTPTSTATPTPSATTTTATPGPSVIGTALRSPTSTVTATPAPDSPTATAGSAATLTPTATTTSTSTPTATHVTSATVTVTGTATATSTATALPVGASSTPNTTVTASPSSSPTAG